MRFGELLLSRQHLEWADKYLAYNQLKHILNDVVSDKLKELKNLHYENGDVGQSKRTMPSHHEYESYKRFQSLLESNINQIKEFYESKKATIQVELEFFKMRVRHENQQRSSASSSSVTESKLSDRESKSELDLTSSTSNEKKLLNHIVDTTTIVLLLKDYIFINVKGIHKILKKHDKVTGGNPLLMDSYRKRLEAGGLTDIASNVELDALFVELENIYNSLSGNPLPPIVLSPRKLPFDFASRYNAFLIDMDGVIYKGNKLLSGVKSFIQWLHTHNKKFLFLTNSSDKTPAMLQAKLARLGINVDISHFYTSALCTAQFLKQQLPNGKAFVIGDKGLVDALEDVGYVITDNHPDYVVVGETTDYSYEIIQKAINLVRKGARLIGTNLDTVDKVETGFAPSVGSLIAPISAATSTQPYFLGKPNPLMMFSGIASLNTTRHETLMIGDRMDTDIIGGLESGIDTLLLLSGVTTLDDLSRFAFRPTHMLRGIDELVQCLFANTPSRKDLCLIAGNNLESVESFYVEGEIKIDDEVNMN